MIDLRTLTVKDLQLEKFSLSALIEQAFNFNKSTDELYHKLSLVDEELRKRGED